MRREVIVLALAPVHRGVGFIAFDEGRQPIDWGVKQTGAGRRGRHLDCIHGLLGWYRPGVVVLEDAQGARSRRRKRMRRIIADMASLIEAAGTAVILYERTAVAAELGLAIPASKDSTAAAIAQKLPVIAHRLPPARRLWESEKHSMAIFEAAGLALTHFGRTQASDAASA